MSRPDLNFDSLNELHDSVNQLLHSPDIKPEKKWVHEVSEASLKMADSCAAAKDLLLLAKDHLQNLQSAFRHVAAAADAGANHAGNNFASHRLPRKQLKKAIMKRLDSLKGMESTITAAASPPPEDQSLEVVVDMLKEVRATTLMIVRSLLSLIAMPNPDRKQDSGRKDPVFRIRLTRVDSLRFLEKCDVSDIRSMMKKLEEVEMVVEDLEAELEGMYRRLVRTRASLLNILTSSE
ncbi:hypothetical protein CDL12_22252 [Handroanthus impetiginosus]|uniref:Uncharacterized protein n=1 Tax=Handroanthus impetiginosus TaxID=429701 RepID=A0A2G9GIT6_9LAMI|nr:hypothetical protein CDL12_22252 [Handroanthus impetiginosus]